MHKISATSKNPRERQYDLVIFGASTTVRSLVLQHVHSFFPKGLSWAIVTLGKEGEDTQLERVQDKCSISTPAIEVCSYSKIAVNSLVKSTKVIVVLSTSCLKEDIEMWVVEACVDNGTHYVDSKSGETCWLKAMMHKYHEKAQGTGAILLSHVNAVGTLQDLLTFRAVTDLSDKLSLKTKEAICFFPLSSSQNYVYNNPSFCQNRKHSLHDATPPWYLSSLRGRDSSGGTNAFGIRKELSLGLLAASSASASHNRALVHRSWALLDGGKQYGCNFYYNEYEKVPSTIEGIKARLGKRKHVTNIEFCKEKDPKINLRVVAVADQEGPFPDRSMAELTYTGGPVQLTTILVAQVAATLLYTKNLSKRTGCGFLTPAVLGNPYLERLSGVGVDIESSLL